MRKVSWLTALLVLIPLAWAGCGPSEGPRGGNGESAENPPRVAYVTNGIASFWVIADAGARRAGEEFEVEVEVRMPPEGIADQKRMIEELLTLGVDGMAVSPIDPANQTDLLNLAAGQTILITHDSDAPESKRVCYVGMDNYEAGRLCGELVKDALPEGGEIMIFVGRLEQLNARLRRQGLIDELLDRSHDSSRFDPPDQVVAGEKYTILGTKTDNFDFGKAKAQGEEAIAAHPSLKGMVGLFAYNPPKLIEALKASGKLGEIQVIGFDEEDPTLEAIQTGHCYGTVVQNPYMYGYESVRILAALARGDRSVLPESGVINIPARKITKNNVDTFWAELKERLAGNANEATAEKVQVAFVTNNASDFWKIAEAGVRKAEKEFNAECELKLPPNGTADDQQRIVEDLIARGTQAMAISPNDAENQVGLIDRAADAMPVITHDSDAPKSKRLVYVGTNNYQAGREAGKLIKEVLPEGGKIMLFVGRMDAQNAIDRSNGIKDEIEGAGIEILDTRTDLTDRSRAKQNAEDTIAQHPDLGCLVGLWSYNGPAILEAVRGSGKAGEIPIVCFDEEENALQGVQDGHIHATVVQQPYLFGYESVRIMAALARGDRSVIPEGGVLDVPVQIIRRGNVEEFRAELARLKSGA